ncbi:unnamed protein product [Rhizophagus irregularis]|nr:unnamed protein product [Rhizophagus irregularis]
MKFLAKFILPLQYLLLLSVLLLYTRTSRSRSCPSFWWREKNCCSRTRSGSLSVGSEQVATWWSTGFTSDDPITVTTHEESGTTPIFSADSTLNKGSTQIPIDDKYTPGTNYVTEVSLKSDPSIKGGPPPPDAAGGKAPEPSGKGPEPSGKGPEPSGKEPEPSGKGPEPSGKDLKFPVVLHHLMLWSPTT